MRLNMRVCCFGLWGNECFERFRQRGGELGVGRRRARLEREASVVEAAEDVGGGVEVEVGEVVGVELEVVLVGVDAGGDALVGCWCVLVGFNKD